MNTQAVIYTAKSTQDRLGSIPTQLEECREMCANEGWTVAAEYSDEGFSAYSGNRGPAWQQAQNHAARLAAESGEDAIVMLVAQAHDRFARGAGDKPGAPESLGEIWHRTRRLNVHLRTVEDDEELRDESAVAAIGRRAHIDSARKSKSVTKGMARRRALGIHAGGNVYGYDRDDIVGLVENSAQADVVRRIFTMVAQGTPQSEVARTLNAEIAATGHPRPLRAAIWNQGSISTMLRRRTYLGEIPADHWRERQNPNRVTKWQKGAHKAIVSDELFAAASASNATRVQRGGDGGRRPRAGHLLTGPLFRHSCGAAMVPRSYERQKDGTVTGKYQCGGKKTGTCEGLVVDMAPVDDAVLAYLADVGVDAEESIRRARQAGETAREQAAAQLAEAEPAVAKAKANLDRVRNDYLAGDIDAADWQGFRAELEAAQAGAIERRDRIKAAAVAAPAEEAVPLVVDALALVRTAAEERNGDGVRQILHDLFDHFVLLDAEYEPNVAPVAQAAAAASSESFVRQIEPDEAAELELPEARPVEADAYTIIPIPKRSALAGLTDDEDRVFLVDKQGRDVFRRVTLEATSYVKGLHT